MLYETLSQPIVILVMFISGIIAGIVFDITNFSCFLCAEKKFARILLDFLGGIISFFIYYSANLLFNFGSIRFFTILIFILSLLLERFTVGKLFAKSYLSCYNWFVKIIKKLQEKRSKRHERKHKGKED